MEENNTAKKHNVLEQVDGLLDKAIIAPTMITLDMALVTDMSGACNAGVTFHTT